MTNYAEKNVVLLSGSLKLSGSSTWMLNLHQGFRLLGVNVIHIITSDSNMHGMPKDFRVFYTGAINKKPLVRLVRALRLHKWAALRYAKIIDYLFDRAVIDILEKSGFSEQVDLLVKDFTAYLPPVLARYPVVPTIHQQLSINWHNPRLREKALQPHSHFVSVSRAVLEDAKALGVSVDAVIYNPIDVTIVRNKSMEYTVDLDDYIVFVGSLNANKGIFQLLDAFRLINEQVKLCYVGSGKDEMALRAKVEDLGLQEHVVFTGFLANPYPYIRAARLLVLPTQSDTMGESMGYVAVEAFILQTPIIVTDFRGANEFYEDDTIILQEPREDFYLRLSEAIQSVLDGKRTGRMKQSVLAEMHPENVARRFIDLVS